MRRCRSGTAARQRRIIHTDWPVLRSDGCIPDGFVGHAPGLPHDAQSARDLLRGEGVGFNHAGKASDTQRFRYEHWRGRAATSWTLTATDRPRYRHPDRHDGSHP